MSVVTAEDYYPHGLRCMDCGRDLYVGCEYRERLVSLGRMASEDTATVEIICGPCEDTMR